MKDYSVPHCGQGVILASRGGGERRGIECFIRLDVRKAYGFCPPCPKTLDFCPRKSKSFLEKVALLFPLLRSRPKCNQLPIRRRASTKSLIATLNKKLVHQQRYATRAAARQSLFDYFELFYNRQRRHSALGYRTPATVYHLPGDYREVGRGGLGGRGRFSTKSKNNGGDSPLQSQTSAHFLRGGPNLGSKVHSNVENKFLIIQSFIPKACWHRA